jgi:hypothetical protein
LGNSLTTLTVCTALTRIGYPLSAVRVLEILDWAEIEPTGYYRSIGPATQVE